MSQGAVEHRNTERDCSIPALRELHSFTKLGLGILHLIAKPGLLSAWGQTR